VGQSVGWYATVVYGVGEAFCSSAGVLGEVLREVVEPAPFVWATWTRRALPFRLTSTVQRVTTSKWRKASNGMGGSCLTGTGATSLPLATSLH
jgi:hypothetical protein